MKHRSIIICAVIALGGCINGSAALNGSLDKNLGQAVQSNRDAQAISPSPEQKADTHIPADPARAETARQNYRQNTVPEPHRTGG